MLSQLGGMYSPFYSLSKAAMNRGTELLAEDPALTSRGITVAAVTPGWCRVRHVLSQNTRHREQCSNLK